MGKYRICLIEILHNFLDIFRRACGFFDAFKNSFVLLTPEDIALLLIYTSRYTVIMYMKILIRFLDMVYNEIRNTVSATCLLS